MDQVERALLVVSGDAASGKLLTDSHVSCCLAVCFCRLLSRLLLLLLPACY